MLVNNCQICGCDVNQECQFDGTCRILTCSDGTVYDKCSTTKPKYCSNGILINNCTTCGCGIGQICKIDMSCVYFETNPGCDPDVKASGPDIIAYDSTVSTDYFLVTKGKKFWAGIEGDWYGSLHNTYPVMGNDIAEYWRTNYEPACST